MHFVLQQAEMYLVRMLMVTVVPSRCAVTSPVPPQRSTPIYTPHQCNTFSSNLLAFTRQKHRDVVWCWDSPAKAFRYRTSNLGANHAKPGANLNLGPSKFSAVSTLPLSGLTEPSWAETICVLIASDSSPPTVSRVLCPSTAVALAAMHGDNMDGS